MTRAIAAIAVALVVIAVAGDADAHPLAPASLRIDERAPGAATARFRAPVAAGLTPVWPAACTASPLASALDGDGDVLVEDFQLDCGGRSLAGAELGVDGLARRDAIALVRVHLAGGGVVHDVLGPSRPRAVIPQATPWPRVLAGYVRLGFDHLLAGLDHVLFVVGLLFLVRGARARLLTLTAFTAGHAATLALAALGLVRVPAAPVEILIALTLIILAVQIAERRAAARRAWLLAAGFGLIHGLGFAGALSGAGLDRSELPLALAGFHLGIELGQLAVVAAAALVGALAPLGFRRAGAPVAAHAIGALAAMWCLERAWAALA